MRDAYDEFEHRSVRMIVIGNGRLEHAQAFRKDLRFQGELRIDVEMEAYRAAGLRRGVLQALSLRTLAHAWRALRAGFRVAGVQGDPWQLGGAFVVTPAGNVAFSQISREAGDHAQLPELLAAIDGINPRNSSSREQH